LEFKKMAVKQGSTAAGKVTFNKVEIARREYLRLIREYEKTNGHYLQRAPTLKTVNGGGKSGHSAAQKLAIFPVLITDAGVDQRLGGCAHHIACIRQGALARQGQSVDARVIY
jgi:hypothetical protein